MSIPDILRGSIAVLAVTTGHAPRDEKVWSLPLEETATRIVADNSGAWVVVNRCAIAATSKRQPPTYCQIRRYRSDGSTERSDDLGGGLCRELRSDSQGLLALLVSDAAASKMSTVLWQFDGESWKNTGTLPCIAVGVYRLKDGALLIWDETRLFRSKDDGRSWDRLTLKGPEPGRTHFSRGSVIGELSGGVMAFAISVYEGQQRNTVRVGTFAETIGFVQKISIEGRLASTSFGPDGDLLLLVHVSRNGDGEPALKLYSTKTIAEWSPRILYEEEAILPEQLVTSADRLLIVGRSWIQPKSFLSVFPTRVIALSLGAGGKWTAKRDTKLDAWNPRIVALAPNGGAWCTFSNMQEHGLVFVE